MIFPRSQGASVPVPRELLNIWIEVDDAGVTVLFELGEIRRPRSDGWFCYGVRVSGPDGVLERYFSVRFSPAVVTVYVFEFAQATHIYYDPRRVHSQGWMLVARFPGSSLGMEPGSTVAGSPSLAERKSPRTCARSYWPETRV